MMTGGFCGYLVLRLAGVISILCVFVFNGSASAQEGFLSLACCADSNFTDPSTSITWISDNSWFPDRNTCRNITSLLWNKDGNGKNRVFEIASGKRCYHLATIKNQDYVIRGTFIVGDSGKLRDNSFFGVFVGATQLGVVNSTQNFVVETVFVATRNYADFCLEKGRGDPYISELELRPLLDAKYLSGPSSGVLKVVKRANVGNVTLNIRYPDDPSDRIWEPQLETDPAALPLSSSAVTISCYNATVGAPLRVLQTALAHRSQLVFLHSDLDEEPYEYRVFFYFLELNETVKPGQRLIDIIVNGEKKVGGFDILAEGNNCTEVSVTITANGFLNLTLAKASDGSELGPICNAYEILQLRPWIQETNQKDVEIMMKVRDELLVSNEGNEVLGSWSGDPCLPLPWDGLACELSNGSSVVTKLDVSASKFQGRIPLGITMLAYLKTLNLSNNKFTGNIPSFPDSSLLSSLDLSHNDLAGRLPPSLLSLTHLETLYYGCNPQLDKELQYNFSRTALVTDHGDCDHPAPPNSVQGIIIGTITSASFLLVATVGSLYLCFCRRKFLSWERYHGKEQLVTKNIVICLPGDDPMFKSISIQEFTLDYIENATQNYKTLIGEGGFGSVYRGTLPDGQDVAVKVRSATSSQGTREFDNEVSLLSDIRHENLVPLIGFCRENDQQILVYPFMSNGSLQERLYGEPAKRKTLDWPTRLSIALGAARGLTYLHSYHGRCIIHRDVKSSNILLDHTMCAKVADFGFSKYAPQEGDSGASLEVRGTAGYLDPEYYTTQNLSAKSDVFSFGVVLLEIVTGREPLNIHRPRNEWSLVEWAKPYVKESKIEEIVDPGIRGGYHAEAMWRVVEAALQCIETCAAYRPCMADIVRELEDALIIENNASEYMRSIDSFGGYSLGGSNRFSVATDKRIALQSTATVTDTSSVAPDLDPPEPR